MKTITINKKYKSLSKIIENSKNVVFMTGAGVSTLSGVPDFRGAKGLYKEVPEEMLSHDTLETDPKKFYDFYCEKILKPLQNAKPNKVHQFIADLEREGKCSGVITQNIDLLHEDAGSKNVIKLHGTVNANYCPKCGREHRLYSDMQYMPIEGVPFAEDSIPVCKDCHTPLRPGIVLYDEVVPIEKLDAAVALLQRADALIVMGTSLEVKPASTLLQYFYGDKLVILNKAETKFDQYADLVLHEDFGKVLVEN